MTSTSTVQPGWSRKLLDVAGYVHAKAQRVCDGCFDAMTSLGSLEQRRPDLVMISPGKTAAAVAAAADAISSERWQVGAELEVYSKKTETWRSGEIRSLPDEDMVEVVYTIDVPEPDTPRLKLCLRSSERLRWPKEEELLTITVRHDCLPNDVSRWVAFSRRRCCGSGDGGCVA